MVLQYSKVYQLDCQRAWVISEASGIFAMLLTMCCAALSHVGRVWLSETLWTAACQNPLSLGWILQARILEWVSMPFSRAFFWPRDWTRTQILVCMKKIQIFFWSTMKSLSVSFHSDGSTFIKFLFLFFFVLNAAFVINILHKASVWWMNSPWY